MASLTAALSRIDWATHRWVATAYLGVAAVLNLCFWGEIAQPSPARPLMLRIGWHLEQLGGFPAQGCPLTKPLVQEKVCTFQASNFFINLPLVFYLQSIPLPAAIGPKSSPCSIASSVRVPPTSAWTITSHPSESNSRLETIKKRVLPAIV